MTNEIKEIRDYIACPQLGDDYYGEWGALRLDQRLKIKELLDYITNLQDKLKWYENIDPNKTIDKFRLEQNMKVKNLHQRIDKAIKYIENDIDLTGINGFEKLLDILRGDE